MAKKGYSKCKGCEKTIPTVESHVYSGKKYCNECYQIKLQEKQEYDNLIDCMMILFDIDRPSGLMLKQIKEYKEKFNYSVGGIHYTLWYCNEIKHTKFDKKFGIAIVKYEYENAENYFKQQQKIKDSVKNIETKVRHIKIQSKSILHTNKNTKINLLVDLDQIIKDGE